ncbi:MAG: hypothetical protein ACTHJ0_02140 [Flavipsychrobacter sp.]
MKKIIAIVLLFGVLIQSMNKLVVIFNYQLNKDYISKNLCENRNHPERKCCGKCYLKKQLNNTEKDNNKNKTDERFGVDYFISYFSFVPRPQYPEAENIIIAGLKPQLYSFNPLLSVFHPPKV